MNRRDRRNPLASTAIESLEGRRLLSKATALVAPPGRATAKGTTYLDLAGTASGIPSTVVGNPDVGTTVDFKGVGDVGGFGPARLGGALHGTGFIASSHVEGTITLAGPRGSLTLQLQSPSKGGFTAPGSGTYDYAIAKGTGSFLHGFGTGSVNLTLGSRAFTMSFEGKPAGD